MKIPRHLNATLDRAADHARIILIILLLAVAAATAPWIPALAAFALGVGAGGVAIHLRMAAKVARLRAETDDLLRENGALHHEKTVTARATAASGTSLTQKFPSIREENLED
ncbi:MAG: hypothetical protein JWP48_444 [Actinoallomurus sp.]|jgi:hypothetical protein|nr:hypothetical protein [Actinoallomurus sp.]